MKRDRELLVPNQRTYMYVLPDLPAAELTMRALPALAAHAGAIDTVAVDTCVGVAARVQHRRRRGGGGGGAYVDHPADERRPQ